MGDREVLAESIIKIEEVKEEPMDQKEDYCWSLLNKYDPGAIQHSIKEENDKDEELELPVAVLVQPVEKQERAFIEETKTKDEPSTLQHSIEEDDTDENDEGSNFVVLASVPALLQEVQEHGSDENGNDSGGEGPSSRTTEALDRTKQDSMSVLTPKRKGKRCLTAFEEVLKMQEERHKLHIESEQRERFRRTEREEELFELNKEILLLQRKKLLLEALQKKN